MNLKLTHTEGDVEFVRAEDVEIGADSAGGQMAYSVALKLPEGWVDYIRAVRSVERMPDAPFHYNHATGYQSVANGWQSVETSVCTGYYPSCPVDSGECMECSKRDCPFGDPLHYHHDGCPTCTTERMNHEHDLEALADEEQKRPTPLGDRIRKSLAERMSQHYSEQLLPYEMLQLQIRDMEQRINQLMEQLTERDMELGVLKRLLINRINRGR